MLRIIRHLLLFAVLFPLAANAQITDCNYNNIDDAEDIASGYSIDADQNGIPDECDRAPRWTWVRGANIPDPVGNHGERGVEADTNEPPPRSGAACWTDTDGNFWLFGGMGPHNEWWNDTWKYNVSTGRWTWMAGTKLINQPATYGQITDNTPAAMAAAMTWTAPDGSFWLYGGYTFISPQLKKHDDMWRFDPATVHWTLVKGDPSSSSNRDLGTKGVASDSTSPGGLNSAAAWTDNEGNLWMFGGSSIDTNNDTWKYNPATNQWTWVAGSGLNPLNSYEWYSPQPKTTMMAWKNSSGQLCTFGGVFYSFNNSSNTAYFGDIWQCNPQDGTWTRTLGTGEVNKLPVFGKMGIESAGNTPGSLAEGHVWKDNLGDVWLYCGRGRDAIQQIVAPLSSLWRLNHTNNRWTWISGTKQGIAAPVYGSRGTPGYSNTPGFRFEACTWTDQHGNVWLFGGRSNWGVHNDLWKLAIGEEPPAEQNWIVK